MKKKHIGSKLDDLLQADRLLDPDNPSVMIGTLEKAAAALNRRLNVELR